MLLSLFVSNALALSTLGAAPPGIVSSPAPSPLDDVLFLGDPVADTTLEGRLFYADHRDIGLVDWRTDVDGDPGDGTEGQLLGAWYTMLEIFEVDDNGFLPGCSTAEEVASAWVARDGSFSATFSAREGCLSELEDTPRYKVRARMRYCNEDQFCVEVGPDEDDGYYSAWSTTAVAAAPGSTVDLGDFQWADDDPTDAIAVAVNQYASLIDANYRIHREAGVPFRYGTYGALHAWVGTGASDGRGTSPGLIEVQLKEVFPEGGKIMHEYGHAVHRRAWAGDYAGFPNPIQSWDPTTREQPFIAFKEGWANFIQRWVTGDCASASLDDDYAFPATGDEGRHYVENNNKLLCDLSDARIDDNPSVTFGAGDRMYEDLWTIWSILDGTDNHVADYGGSDPVAEGLSLCDFVDYDLEIRHDAATVGTADHDERVWAWSNLLANNDITCPHVPAPTDVLAYDLDVDIAPISYADTVDGRGNGTRNIVTRVTVTNEHPYQPSTGYSTTVTRTRLGVTTTVASDVNMTGLEEGASRSFDTTIAVPIVARIVQSATATATVPAGAYETDPSDNTASIVLNASTFRPDLTVEITDWEASTALWTTTWTASALIRNEGLSSTGSTFAVALKGPSGATIGSAVVLGGLGAGASRTVTLTGSTSALGGTLLRTLSVVADSGSVITERDETNNTDTVVTSELPFGGESWSELVWDDSFIEMSILAMQVRHDMIEALVVEPWWEPMIIDPTDQLILEQLRESPSFELDPILSEEALLVDPDLLDSYAPDVQPYVMSLRALR